MVKDHLGNEYDSIAEMCKTYSIKLDTFLKRRERGLSIEEALTRPVGKGSSRAIIDPNTGIIYESMRAICLEYNIPYNAFYHRIEKGMDVGEALSYPSNRNNVIKDHLGNVFRSQQKMCEHYKIQNGTFQSRIDSGWSVADALTIPVKEKIPAIDPWGHYFPTIKEMCRYHGINKSTFNKRISCGMSVANALTFPLKEAATFIDHEGNSYRTLGDMCGAYGITTSAFQYRQRQGWDLKRILTTPLAISSIECVDHNGQNYSSANEMCKAYGISYATYHDRITRKWSIEKALTTPPKSFVFEYEGKQYDNINTFLREIGSKVSAKTFLKRRTDGWSIEDSIKFEANEKSRVVDFKGNEYPSQSAMCHHYNVDISKYRGRMRMGWSQEDALLLKSEASYGEYCIEKELVKYGLEFEYQFCGFTDCKYVNVLRHDFAVFFDKRHIPENVACTIEFNGEQHEHPVRFGGMSKEQARELYLIGQMRDKAKEKYLSDKGIPQFVIWYNEFHKIESVVKRIADSIDDWMGRH